LKSSPLARQPILVVELRAKHRLGLIGAVQIPSRLEFSEKRLQALASLGGFSG